MPGEIARNLSTEAKKPPRLPSAAFAVAFRGEGDAASAAAGKRAARMILAPWTHHRPARWGRYSALPIRGNDARYGNLSSGVDADQAALLT
jgi:hypothetical protein